MRFVLDQDVPVTCRKVLLAEGHEAWTVGEAGRATAVDDDQTIYAMNEGATLVTLDREFTERRKKNAIGRHVRIDCVEFKAAALLKKMLPVIVPILERRQDITIVCWPDGFRVFSDWA